MSGLAAMKSFRSSLKISEEASSASSQLLMVIVTCSPDAASPFVSSFFVSSFFVSAGAAVVVSFGAAVVADVLLPPQPLKANPLTITADSTTASVFFIKKSSFFLFRFASFRLTFILSL